MIQGSSFTKDIVDKNYERFQTQFQEASTLPDFFKEISKNIPRIQKCRFFKDWLEEFITSYIRIERTWYFDLFPKIQPIQRLTNKTRKNTKNKI